MRTSELIVYSRRLIQGRRGEVTLICLLPVCAELAFRAAEAAVFSLILYFTGEKPSALFRGDIYLQSAAAGGLMLLRWAVTAPLLYAASYRLWEICGESEKTMPVSALLTDKRFILRSIAAVLINKTVSFAAAVPALFLAYRTVLIIAGGGGTNELFFAVNCAVLTLAAAVWYLKVKLGMAAVPFLAAESPDTGALRLTLRSARLLRGRKRVTAGIIVRYSLPLLTFYPLAELGTALCLSTAIFLREDEYERQRYTELQGTQEVRYGRA